MTFFIIGSISIGGGGRPLAPPLATPMLAVYYFKIFKYICSLMSNKFRKTSTRSRTVSRLYLSCITDSCLSVSQLASSLFLSLHILVIAVLTSRPTAYRPIAWSINLLGLFHSAFSDPIKWARNIAVYHEPISE